MINYDQKQSKEIYDALSEFQDHPNNHEPHYDNEDDIAGRTQYIISRVFTSAF